MNITLNETQINIIWVAIWTEVDKETEVKIWEARTALAPALAPPITAVNITEKDRRSILTSLKNRKVSDHRLAELIALFTELALPLAVEEATSTNPVGAG